MSRNIVKFPALLLPTVVFVVGASVRAQSDDPITPRLNKAKEAYPDSEEAFRKAVVDRLRAAEERATKAGNKAAVDQAVADREAFEADCTLPKSLRINDLQGQRSRARLDLLAAYNRAIADYTRRRMRPEADAAEREMAEFKAKFVGDQLKAGTVWRGEKRYLKGGPPGTHPFELKVTERQGDAFRAVTTEEEMSHDVEGVVDNGKVSWKITRVRRGAYPGQPQSGVLDGDVMKLHFARRDGSGFVLVEAVGNIKLQKKK
jgi:hypothetical protein